MTDQLHRLFNVFEKVVSTALLGGMVIVVCLAAWSFLRMAVETAASFNTVLDYAIFQLIFDRVLAAVIALELARSVLLLVEGQRGLVQVRIILIIGILAVVRKLILLELESTEAMLLIGLAAAVLALGGMLALLTWLKPPKDGED